MARFGTIGDQYFDDSGDPLVGGKLRFYESGTTTDKTTYADVNLSIPNTNPVILSGAGRQPNIFYDGTAKVVLLDADDQIVETRDPVGGDTTGGTFSTWNSLTLYGEGGTNIVTGSNGLYYRSIVTDNQGNDPTTDATAWEQIKFLGVWNSNATYSTDDIVQASDGLLYSSLIDSNTNNDPTTALAGNWVNTSGGVTGVGLSSATLHFLINSRG